MFLLLLFFPCSLLSLWNLCPWVYPCSEWIDATTTYIPRDHLLLPHAPDSHFLLKLRVTMWLNNLDKVIGHLSFLPSLCLASLGNFSRTHSRTMEEQISQMLDLTQNHQRKQIRIVSISYLCQKTFSVPLVCNLDFGEHCYTWKLTTHNINYHILFGWSEFSR
jgi:hypothetical protein